MMTKGASSRKSGPNGHPGRLHSPLNTSLQRGHRAAESLHVCSSDEGHRKIKEDGEHGKPYPWAVGDSRVSSGLEGGGYLTLSDHAVKVFSLPVTVRLPNGVFRSSLGLAYSGSSLNALNMAQAVAPLLVSLESDAPNQLPTLKDLADLIARVMRNYIHSFGVTHLNWWDYIAECAVLGTCPSSNEVEIYSVVPEVAAELTINVTRLDAAVEGTYLLLGDRKPQIRALIDAERAKHDPGSLPWWRSPWTVIQDCINDQEFPTIGGDIQIGIGNPYGFLQYWIKQPGNGDQPPGMTYLGLSVLDDGTTVGPCRIGMFGMAKSVDQ